MNYYDDQIHDGRSFAERIGDPEEFDAALGRVVEGFSFLEQSLCNVVTLFLGVDNRVAEIITAEQAYRGLVNLFASLFHCKYERGDFSSPEGEDPTARLKELITLCNKAGSLRNKIVHSSYVANRYRIKKTAKANRGFVASAEEMDSAKLLDIADFIVTVGMYVEELPLLLGMADTVSGGPLTVQYLSGEEVIASFGVEVPDET